jgi:hypothetical protein
MWIWLVEILMVRLSVTKSNVHAAVRVLILALAASACDRVPDPQFGRIGNSLKLEIAKVTRSKDGTSAEFVFTVNNAGSGPVNACLGPVKRVSYDTSGPVGGMTFMSNSHPGCMREFTLEPGRGMTWSEAIEMAHLSETRVDVEVEVEVMNPRRCGRFGCATTTLQSNKQRIQ